MFTRSVLLVLACACGRIGFDPVGDDVGPGELEVIARGPRGLLDEGAPIANALVVFDDGNSTVVARTDANGRARRAVAGPTTVHVMYPEGAERFVYTFEDIEPGHTLIAGWFRPLTLIALTVDLPIRAGADYSVIGDGRCGFREAGGPSVAIQIFPECLTPVQLWGVASVGGKTDAWIDLGVVTPTAGATIDATGFPWQPFAVQTFTVDNVPATAQLVAGLALTDRLAPLGVAASAATFPTTTVMVQMVNASVAWVSIVVLESATGFGQSLVFRSGGSPTIDANQMPAVETAVNDPAGRSVHWTSRATAIPQAAVQVQTTITTPSAMIRWFVYVPPSATVAQYPDLPPELAEVAVDVGATWSVSTITILSSHSYDYLAAVSLLAGDATLFDPALLDEYALSYGATPP